MTIRKNSTADQISDMLNNDGQMFETADGRSIFDICEDLADETDQNWERESTRYNFSDGSAIVVSGCAWDLCANPEDDGCFCWAGNGCECAELAELAS